MRYGHHPEQVVDLEGAGDGPVVALIHGGCWRARYDRTLQAAVAADLRARGYRTANVEYRRLDAGGIWPEPLEDVLAAIASAKAEVVVGHSAGGHLALLAAAQLKLLLPVDSCLMRRWLRQVSRCFAMSAMVRKRLQ